CYIDESRKCSHSFFFFRQSNGDCSSQKLLEFPAEVKPLRGREGQTVTLHTGLAKLIITEYKGRFQGRLQLDRETGSLTIRNLTINDAGLYQLQVIRQQVTYHNFIFTVYGECVLYQIVHGKSTNSLLCSVANGKEVTLSWYRGEEKLNNTSSPHQADLSLPLEIKGKNSDTYSCVATNPVSNQTTKLSIEEHCLQHAGMSTIHSILILYQLILSVFVGLFCFVLRKWTLLSLS
uniref:Ig-like domain-containing protein n=1 Tax=Salmo trutta TaxID=8032 RepID=A0A673YCV7_SALTR